MRPFPLFCSISLLTLALAVPARAETPCLITYEAFEVSVPHIDVEECPAGEVTADEGFCRIGIERGLATTFVFRYEEGQACLVEADTQPVGSFLRKYAYIGASE